MRTEGRRPQWVLAAACVAAAIVACSGDVGGGAGSVQKSGPLDVPHSWRTARLSHGHAVHVGQQQLACEQCHTIASGKFDNPGPLPCLACHVKQGRIQHASARAQAELGPAAQADCTDCHAFSAPAPPGGDAGRGAGAWDCGRCHDAHRSDPASGTAVVAHQGAACSACHTPHGDAPASAGNCATCHAAVVATHGRVERAGATLGVPARASESSRARCQVCHQRLHDPASAGGDGCVECHESTAPIVGERALTPGGHERCTSCHAPHGFAPAEVVACASCHAAQPAALASTKVAAHAACESCHQPHDPGADPSGACASCHRPLTSDHPTPAGGSACTSCHAAHPPAASRGALHAASAPRACSECHQKASGDGGFHARGVACRECHAPHRFKLTAADMAPCERCHASELQHTRRLGAGHGACQQCHAGLPHDTTGEPRACDSCHAQQSRGASAGHRACQGCHEPHAGQVKSTCASCHAAVLASAPAGHRACQGCHEPHTGDLAVAGCTTCHADKEKASHHAVPGGCGACHSAHGPSAKAPPACNTCHERVSSAGLHAVEQHSRCQDCHGAHVKQPRPEPEACRSCHQDRAQHFSDARRCSGCHLFESL